MEELPPHSLEVNQNFAHVGEGYADIRQESYAPEKEVDFFRNVNEAELGRLVQPFPKNALTAQAQAYAETVQREPQ